MKLLRLVEIPIITQRLKKYTIVARLHPLLLVVLGIVKIRHLYVEEIIMRSVKSTVKRYVMPVRLYVTACVLTPKLT